MNKLVTTSLFAAVAALFVAPQPARAGGDEAAAAFGGFVGGLILGTALNDDHDQGRYDDHSGVHVSTRIVLGDGHRHGRHRHHDHGYWNVARVRVWVPGYWNVQVDDCGRRYRHFVRGHYEFRRERVWIPTGRHGRCDVCR
jgi:hypothetical protein